MPSASLPTIDERVVSEFPPTDGLRLRASPSVVGSALHRCKALISGLTSRSHSRGLGLSLGRRAAKGAAPATIVEDGLVAEWRLDEGSGQTITDCTGNGHNGVLGFTAGVDPFDPTWTAQGLSFDGTEAAWFADAVGISGGVARTVIAVVKTGSSAEFGMEWGGTGGNGERWALDRSSAGSLRLDLRGANFTSALALPASTWSFIAGTQSGADLDTVTLYLNGLSEASGVSATIETTNGFIVGEATALTKQMEAAYVLVYDRALSEVEVEQNRRALRSILAGRGITLPMVIALPIPRMASPAPLKAGRRPTPQPLRAAPGAPSSDRRR